MLQRLPVSATFIKFLIVGGVGYLVNQFTLFLLYDSPLSSILPAKGTDFDLIFFTHPDIRLLIASAIAVEASIVSNFFWHERWTFHDRDRRASLLIRFGTFNFTSIGSPLISVATVNILVPNFGVNPYIANTIGIGLGTAWNWTWNSMVIWPQAEGDSAESDRAGWSPSAFWPGDLQGLVATRRLSIALTGLFFVVTLLVYQWVNGGPTAFNPPVLLADALLHGRLDIANGAELTHIDWAFYDGKFFIVEPPMTALVVLPGVILFGLALNQALVSVIIGAINAAAVHRLLTGLKQSISVQIWLTVLFAFGTVYWWNAVNGGVWYFAHAVAVLFLIFAIYETLVGKRPFTAGLFLGAAFLSRLPILLALPFFIIMFSDQWLRTSEEKPLLKRIDLKPLLLLGVGLGIFGVLDAGYNFYAFDTPLPAAYHHWSSYAEVPTFLLEDGLWSAQYYARHAPVVFQALPIFRSEAPFLVMPAGGMAIWATTPAFIYALFVGIKTRRVLALGLALFLAGLLIALVFTRGDVPDFISSFSRDFPEGLNFPYGMEFLPFILLIGLALSAGFRNADKLVLACWSAIIPIALVHFAYPLTGWPQFGYRFSLDYLPFLFLLVVKAVGNDLRWHHKLLIILSVAINLMGVLWTYEFGPDRAFGLDWTGW